MLTFDMGGTTAKLGAIDGGEPAITPTFEVDQVRYRKGSGLPINVPAVELLEIGAGGGSIARDRHGADQGGTRRAPAPIRGPSATAAAAREPTVTDANVVLGYINPDYFNGGAMRLDAKAAGRRDRSERIGEPLGLDAGEAAWGIHAIANANMERAMRIVSVERGRDPRKYALVAFGGAGPLHAARLARALGIPKIIVPYGAGVGSAIGMLEANAKLDASMTRVLRLARGRRGQIDDIYRQLEARVRADLQRMGASAARRRSSRFAYLRYAGQGHEIRVDLPAFPVRRRLCRRDRGPLRGGLPEQVRLSPGRRRGGGRRLVHRRHGRQARAGAHRAKSWQGRPRGRSAAARARPISRSRRLSSTAPSSTAALCPSAKSSRDPPSSRRRRPPRCCCPAATASVSPRGHLVIDAGGR